MTYKHYSECIKCRIALYDEFIARSGERPMTNKADKLHHKEMIEDRDKLVALLAKQVAEPDIALPRKERGNIQSALYDAEAEGLVYYMKTKHQFHVELEDESDRDAVTAELAKYTFRNPVIIH
jgi:hypothetical protein